MLIIHFFNDFMTRMDMWRLGLCLTSALISGICQAESYGQYQLDRLVNIDRQQQRSRVELEYLDLWLADLESYTRTPGRQFESDDERQRAKTDLRALESIVGLAVLEPDSAPLVKRCALLANIAYHFGLDGAAERADLAFNRWLLLSPQESDVHYHYGRFLLASGQYPRAVFYLKNAFSQGVLDAELLLGMALLKLGERDEAESYLRHYRLTHPGDARVLSLLQQSQTLDMGKSQAKTQSSPYVSTP